MNLTVVSDVVDPAFRFMTLDHDGRIRMDPSSPYAMGRLLGLRRRFDVACACDTDHDRHGIVTRSAGLLPSNHYLAAAFSICSPGGRSGPSMPPSARRSSAARIIDRVVARGHRTLYEVPVGFKWFVDGLRGGTLAFAGEESAGAAFLRRDGRTWTTDKDGITAALLAAEITASTGRDPGEHLRGPDARARRRRSYARIDVPATPDEKRRLAGLSPDDIDRTQRGRRAVRQVPHDGAGRRPGHRRHQGRDEPAAGSRPVRLAPKTSTRSTRRASGARPISPPPAGGADHGHARARAPGRRRLHAGSQRR